MARGASRTPSGAGDLGSGTEQTATLAMIAMTVEKRFLDLGSSMPSSKWNQPRDCRTDKRTVQSGRRIEVIGGCPA